jgi:hypothetical protein
MAGDRKTHAAHADKTAVKQSTITNHFATAKTILSNEKKPLADDSCLQAVSSSKRFKSSNLQFSQQDDIVVDQKEDNMTGDDVELSQCCTQPLLSQQFTYEDEVISDGETKPEVSHGDCKRNLAWLHDQVCISGQVAYGTEFWEVRNVNRLFLQNSVTWFDSVHGNFEVPDLCIAIINTPQFQVYLSFFEIIME